MKHESKNNPGISAIDWIIIIAIGVFVGNTLSLSVYEIYKNREHEENLAAQKSAEIKSEALINAETRAAQKKKEKQAIINKQLNKTCEFWKKQVKKENTKVNRQYRDSACAKIKDLTPPPSPRELN